MTKIASLLPSATEILAALGLSEQLVGRSHECDYPPELKKLPVLTKPHFEAEGSSREIDKQVRTLVEKGLSLYEVDTEKLKELSPDIIVTQSQCEVCAVSERELEQALIDWVEKPAQIVSLKPDSLLDVWEDFRRVGRACDRSSEAEELIQKLTAEITKIQADLPKKETWPRVACIEWMDPLMAAGNWMPELVEKAGGINLFGESGKHSPYMSFEDLVEGDPELIFLMPCGFDIPRTSSEMDVLSNKQGWSDLTAVKKNQVYLTDGNQYFNRPGPRLLDSYKILVEIIHPHTFSFGYEGKGWKKFATR